MFNSKKIKELEDFIISVNNLVAVKLNHPSMNKNIQECSKCGHLVNKDFMHDKAEVINISTFFPIERKEKIVHTYTCYTCKPNPSQEIFKKINDLVDEEYKKTTSPKKKTTKK